MESSIAEFLMRWLACELPPTRQQGMKGELINATFPLQVVVCVKLWQGINTACFAKCNRFKLQQHPNRASQRSLHNAPIFRLLLKVAVNGTHQCDFSNFCGAQRSQLPPQHARTRSVPHRWHHTQLLTGRSNQLHTPHSVTLHAQSHGTISGCAPL